MKKWTCALSAWLLVLAIALLGAVGCSGGDATTTTESVDTTAAPAEKTVTDMAGRQVTLPAEINSIATFGAVGVLNTMVEAVSCGDKIINQMPPRFTKTDQWKYQYVFAPQIAEGPVFENADGEIQIETVLEAAPDVCLCMTEETLSVLEAKGLNVVFLQWKTLDDVEPCITLLGEALSRPEMAADYLKWFDETVAKAEGLTAGLSETAKKTVLYGNITSYTQPHYIAEWWISEAGGISVTKDRPTDGESYEYTVEDVLKWNPDVMVASSTKMIEEIKADTRLADVTAVIDNAIFSIPTVAHVWGNRTPEQPLTVLWMMNKLYPDLMSTEALTAEIRDFYNHFFQTELTDAQIAEIIG